MLRQWVDQEFPSVRPALARLPRPTVGRTAPLWAAVAALGGGLLASRLALAAFEPLQVAFAPPGGLVRTMDAAAVIGGLVALPIAYAAGRRPAALLYVAWLVVVQLGLLVRGWSFTHSELGAPFGLTFDPLGRIGATWPIALGLVLGLALRNAVRAREGAANALLEGAGAYAIGQALLPLLTAPFPTLSRDVPPWVLIALVVVPAIVGAAAVLCARSAHPIRDAAILGATLLVAALPLTIPQIGMAARGPVPSDALIVAVFPIGEALALVLFTFLWRRSAAELRPQA